MLVKSISKSKVKGLNNRMQILRCYIKKKEMTLMSDIIRN